MSISILVPNTSVKWEMLKLTNTIYLCANISEARRKVKHCYGTQVRIQTANLEVITRFMENWQIDTLLFNENIAISLHKKMIYVLTSLNIRWGMIFIFFSKKDFQWKSHDKYNLCSLLKTVVQSEPLLIFIENKEIRNVKIDQ